MASRVLLALGVADFAMMNLVLAPRLAHRAEAVAPAPAPAAPAPAAPHAAAPITTAPAPTARAAERADEPAGPDIVFQMGSMQVPWVKAVPQAQRLVAELAARSDRKLVVRGHSDRLGPPETNLALSRQRAEAVARLLWAFGAPPERILIEAAGSSEPADTTETPTGWARNRRVQLLWR